MCFVDRFKKTCQALLLSGLMLALTIGCWGGHRNAPVDAGVARDCLRSALESWKKGDKIDALQSESPPIYVIDPDWQNGFRLKEYQLVNDGEEKDAHLFCSVRLTLVDPKGQESKRDATYVVSTAPNRTVSRKMF